LSDAREREKSARRPSTLLAGEKKKEGRKKKRKKEKEKTDLRSWHLLTKGKDLPFLVQAGWGRDCWLHSSQEKKRERELASAAGNKKRKSAAS